MTQTLRRAIAVEPGHPAFAGHFPGRPLLPGALLLAEIVEVARSRPELADRYAQGATLLAAKFLRPVAPGDALEFALEWDDSGLHFEVTESGRTVARGRWAWHAEAADEVGTPGAPA